MTAPESKTERLAAAHKERGEACRAWSEAYRALDEADRARYEAYLALDEADRARYEAYRKVLTIEAEK